MQVKRYMLEKSDSCLLIIDIQERLFNSMEYDIRKNAVKNTGILIETAKAFNMPIVLTEQYSKGLGPTIPDIKGKIPEVEPLDKTHFNCMHEDAIFQKITSLGKSTVIVCGIETHICVLYTVLSLLDKGMNVVVASDAACSRRKHEWKMAIKAMRAAGAIIYPTETISFMFMGKSGTEEFKRLSPLFK
jgi:nicotinamidase-related amidase